MRFHGGDLESYMEKFGKYPLDFSTNMSPLGIPKRVREAVLREIDSMDLYPDIENRRLVEAISDFEGIERRCVICSNGAVSIIYAVAASISPCKALIVSPCFSEYENALRAYESDVVYHELRRENGFILGEDFIAKIEIGIGIIFLCQPNNPTAQTIEKKLLTRILTECEKKDVLLVMDECFIDFHDISTDYSMKDMISSKNLIIIKAFTKTFSLAGIRLGYAMTGNEKLMNDIKKKCPPWSVSRIAQAAGVQATFEREYVDDLKKFIKSEKKWIVERFGEIGIEIIGSSANFIFFEGDKSLGEKLAKKGILIRSCNTFRGLGDEFYRIGIRKRSDNMLLIRALSELTE